MGNNLRSEQVSLLGTGLIGDFYTRALLGSGKQIGMVYSRDAERARVFADQWDIPRSSGDLNQAIADPETGVVVVGLPNQIHREAVELAAVAGKAILCTKPLARTAEEAREILEVVEQAGVFAGYLEDLVYTPKTLKALGSVHSGAIGWVTWVRSREAHSGPHSGWFWDREQAGGGAIVDLGCHCIEIIRNFVGKSIRPVEVMCWAETLVHPVEAEDNGIALIKFENGALGQFEVSWTFRGGMDLRDEVQGTEGMIWLNHFLRTGFEMFSSGGGSGYVSEKTEEEKGWLFPVGDELAELGYTAMFADMFDSLQRNQSPGETFYDGYVVNAVIDACYCSAQSKRWEAIAIDPWRGSTSTTTPSQAVREFEGSVVIKQERMPDGRVKLILKDPASGRIFDQFIG